MANDNPMIQRRHSAPSGRWRHIVALLAVATWVLTVAICPEVPEAFGAATQPTIHGDLTSGDTGHGDLHGSCDHAAHASAVLHFSKAIRGGITFAGSAPPGVAVPHSVVAAPSCPVIEIARAIDDWRRTRCARFSSFWPHAPPLTL